MQERGIYPREIQLRASSVNEQDRSFQAVVATENPVSILDWEKYEAVDEVLVARGGEFPDWMPLLPNHRRYDVLDVIGSADRFTLKQNQWEGRGTVASPATDNDEVRKIWQRVLEQHIRAVSIGYRVFDAVYISRGKSQSVNGVRYTAGDRTMKISTKWKALELSLTPIGADEMALIRSQMGNTAPQKRSFFR